MKSTQPARLARPARVGGTAMAAGVVALVCGVAFLGPLISGQSSTEFVGLPFETPTADHVLGTDVLGRDVLARVLDGGWRVLLLAGLSLVLLMILATAAGTIAAYFGGVLDTLLMRSLDVLMAFPLLVFALMVVSLTGTKSWILVSSVAVAQLPGSARVVRAAALAVVDLDFVRNAKAIGSSTASILWHEVLPNLRTPLSVEFGLRFTYSIMLLASLDFIGFGQEPPTPTWGSMVNENRVGLEANPWTVVAPVALIALLTVGLNALVEAKGMPRRLVPSSVEAKIADDSIDPE